MPRLRQGKSVPATKGDIERLDATLRENTSDILGYVRDGFNQQEEKTRKLEHRFDGLEHRFDGLEKRFDGLEHHLVVVNTKLDAIMSGEILVTRTQLHRLLRILKTKGIEIDETEVLTA